MLDPKLIPTGIAQHGTQRNETVARWGSNTMMWPTYARAGVRVTAGNKSFLH